MFVLNRFSVLFLTAGLAVLAGCGTTPAGRPGTSAAPVPESSTPAPSPTGSATSPGTPAPTGTCPQPGAYLTAIRVGQHAGFDRVVFEFSGGLPAYEVQAVQSVYSDPKGEEIPLAGQAYLRVVFHGASAWCQQPARETYTGPSVLTPFYPRLLVVSAAGDFEQVLSFGVGTAASGAYHAYTLTGPDRVVLDFSHVPLGKFPGIWDTTTWGQYWARQYAWNNGHQPWLSAPAMVVEAWARSRWQTAPVIRQVSANTFKVTEPGGRVDMVTGTRVITRIVYGVTA